LKRVAFPQSMQTWLRLLGRKGQIRMHSILDDYQFIIIFGSDVIVDYYCELTT